MRRLTGLFIKGLAAILPLVVTIYLLAWIAVTAEEFLGGALSIVLPESLYLPGMGLLLGIGLVILTGLLLQAYLIRRLLALGEAMVQRVPVAKTIYSAVQDFMGFVTRSDRQRADRVVLVRVDIGGTEAEIMGLVTRTDWADLPEIGAGDDRIAVYLPMSYQIGGYTLLVSREQVRTVDLGIDDAMRFALTAGMSTRPPGGAAQHKTGE